MKIFRFILTSLLVLAPQSLFASTYGSGVYGAGLYGSGIKIGPITLPMTGPQLLAVVSAILIALGAGWFVWLRQRRAA